MWALLVTCEVQWWIHHAIGLVKRLAQPTQPQQPAPSCLYFFWMLKKQAENVQIKQAADRVQARKRLL